MKDVDFLWTGKCEQTLLKLKCCVSAAPVLQGPNWELSFHIATDALDIDVGVVLGQLEDKKLYAIYYISKNITPTKLNYIVIEKEFLAVVHAINKFRDYITIYQIFIHTDHSAIHFLMNKPITNGRITCWLFLLQEFDITIVDKPGKDDVVVDSLLRLTIDDSCTPTKDSFPNEYIFSILYLLTLVCKYSQLSCCREFFPVFVLQGERENQTTKCYIYLDRWEPLSHWS